MTENTIHAVQSSSYYNKNDTETSARELVYEVYPQWKTDPGTVVITRFTEGIMNDLLKITKQRPGSSDVENDKESVLLRAYGRDSDILIDRDMEARTHALLAERRLAPPLLARFKNGLLYKFLPGRICTPQDLQKEPIWRAIAARLGEWHARLPLPNSNVEEGSHDKSKPMNRQKDLKVPGASSSRTIWTVMREWVAAVPSSSPEAEARKTIFQEETQKSFMELVQNGHEDYSKYVVGHCDLLSANVIIPSSEDGSFEQGEDIQFANVASNLLARKVHFIDYEYAVPCPAAFDLATHFSEWGGYDCDYSMLPTQATRRMFIEEYIRSYGQYTPIRMAETDAVEKLCREVDRYRGMPGLYWGVQALVQDAISDVKFDWASYAEVRLAEFWAWRGEVDGSRSRTGAQIPFRERRWAQKA